MFGNKLFLPALVIPLVAFLGTLLFNYTPLRGLGLIEPKSGGPLRLAGIVPTREVRAALDGTP